MRTKTTSWVRETVHTFLSRTWRICQSVEINNKTEKVCLCATTFISHCNSPEPSQGVEKMPSILISVLITLRPARSVAKKRHPFSRQCHLLVILFLLLFPFYSKPVPRIACLPVSPRVCSSSPTRLAIELELPCVEWTVTPFPFLNMPPEHRLQLYRKLLHSEHDHWGWYEKWIHDLHPGIL